MAGGTVVGGSVVGGSVVGGTVVAASVVAGAVDGATVMAGSTAVTFTTGSSSPSGPAMAQARPPAPSSSAMPAAVPAILWLTRGPRVAKARGAASRAANRRAVSGTAGMRSA